MSSSGPPAQERHEAVGVGPEEGHEDDQKAGASPLQQQAERIGALQTGEEKALGGLYSSFAVPEGGLQESWGGTFSRACRDRIRSNGYKHEEGRFRLITRKKFFAVGVVRHWNRLPREAVDALCLEVFKASLDGALSNLV